MSATILPGRPAPLGATPGPQGTNFAVSSNGDEVRLCLISPTAARPSCCCRSVTATSGTGWCLVWRPDRPTVIGSADRTIRARPTL